MLEARAVSSNGSITAWLSLPMRRAGSRRRASCRAGPMPSARSRSVVGVMQTLVRVSPRSAMSSR